MKIDTLADAVVELHKYIPQVKAYSGDNMSLDRMWPLLKAIGNPQESLKVIHIAGTSGKTSTSYYIASLLKSAGKRTGLTVSPHVYSITERVQIDGRPLSDEQFCHELGIFLDLVAEVFPAPSYFELLVAFSYWVFARKNVDYAVIETGVGGLLDGTNVARRNDKVCVITDIGYDHVQLLGDTLSKIAMQKAGIIHEDNMVYMYEQSLEIASMIEERVTDKSAKLILINNNELLKTHQMQLKGLPEFQKRNWLLAEQVCRGVAMRDGFSIKSVSSPAAIQIPGRMETVKLKDNSVLVMDGAHNAQKMQTFVHSYRKLYPNQEALVLLALKTGKEYKAVVDALLPITDSFIITTFNTSQYLPSLSQDPVVIKDYCLMKGAEATIIASSEEATAILLGGKNKHKIITGSFYLIGQARSAVESSFAIKP
jgi:dihydrofolate synthase / folylpolyglutamate synthase